MSNWISWLAIIISTWVIMVNLTGCGMWGRNVAKFTGSYEECYDGVIYIQFTSGVTVKYRRDGSIATCE
jgi:hypothetical protein